MSTESKNQIEKPTINNNVYDHTGDTLAKSTGVTSQDLLNLRDASLEIMPKVMVGQSRLSELVESYEKAGTKKTLAVLAATMMKNEMDKSSSGRMLQEVRDLMSK